MFQCCDSAWSDSCVDGALQEVQQENLSCQTLQRYCRVRGQMMDNFMLISWIDRQLDRLSSEELEGQEHVRWCMTSQRRHVTSLKHKVNNTLSCMQHCVPPCLHYKAAESTQIGCCGLFLFLCSDWTLRALKLSQVTNLWTMFRNKHRLAAFTFSKHLSHSQIPAN